MPHKVLGRVLREWIGECCSPEDADAVVTRLLEMGIRPPMVTITEQADLDLIPNGAAVAVGNLLDGKPTIGEKVEHAILFAGEDECYPFHADGLAPPLPCTVIWAPKDGRNHFRALYARLASGLFGLDEQDLLREYAEDDE